MKGEGNELDYGMRVYDLRLGRFLSVDPLSGDYPWNSTYAYAENSPVVNIDLDGLEKISSNRPFTNYNSNPVTNNKANAELMKRAGDIARNTLKKEAVRKTTRKWGASLLARSPILIFIGAMLLPANLDYSGPGVSDGNELSFKDMEIFTDDPSKLTDYYLGEVKKRIMSGNASANANDRKYLDEMARRDILGITLVQDRNRLVGPEYRRREAEVKGGKVQFVGSNITSGRFDFVILNDGRVFIGSGHVNLSQDATSVLVAGGIKLLNGVVREFTNSTGHYMPSIKEANEGIQIMNNMGVDFSNARITLYHLNGEVYETYRYKDKHNNNEPKH